MLSSSSRQREGDIPQIFAGLSIHVNGWTNPSHAELRAMIVQRGGDFQHYCIYLICELSRSCVCLEYGFIENLFAVMKSKVTHIIATNLTNSKMKEFR